MLSVEISLFIFGVMSCAVQLDMNRFNSISLLNRSPNCNKNNCNYH